MDNFFKVEGEEADRNVMEQVEAAKAADQLLRDKQALGFLDLFTSPNGMAFLDLARGKTIELSLLNLDQVIGDNDRQLPLSPAEWAYFREGQNSVIRWIENELRHAEYLKMQPNTDKGE